jgi:type IX secretion system PorP/SprF family membrane protein
MSKFIIKNISAILLLLLTLENLSAQESSIYDNYYLNTFIINPAATGSNYYPEIDLYAKKQWLGFDGSPSTYFLSGNYCIGNYDFYNPKQFINKGPLKLKDRVGIGAAVFNDNYGPMSNTGGLISYAYHLPVNHINKLSFGLSFIGTYHLLNTSELKPEQPDDPHLYEGESSLFRFNFNLGVIYSTENYYFGISVNKFLKDVSDDNFIVSMTPSYYIIGGYKFNSNKSSFDFEPSIVVKKLGDEPISGDVNLKLYVNNFHWIALSYSTTGKINLRFGLKIYKHVYLGYGYEQSLSNIAQYNYGSHEIHLGINLGLYKVEGVDHLDH